MFDPQVNVDENKGDDKIDKGEAYNSIATGANKVIFVVDFSIAEKRNQIVGDGI